MRRLLAALLLAPLLALADPAISNVTGVLAHGGGITITGTDFGTKAIAAPMLYDHFDTAAGDICDTSGDCLTPFIRNGALASYVWTRGGATAAGRAITRDTDAPHARSTYHARMDFTSDLGSHWALNFDLPYDLDTGDELYFTYYYRVTKTHASVGRQVKSLVWYSSGGNDQGYFNAAFGNCQEDARWRGELLDVAYRGDHSVTTVTLDGEWHRQEVWIKQGAEDTANGNLDTTIYRPTGTPSKDAVASGSIVTRTDALVWSSWELGGGYYDDCTGVEGATIDIDDVYVDSTRSRVEICAEATWAGRAKCEIATPSSWSATSVSARLRNWHHGDDDTVYVYVVKSDGTVNANGFEITLASPTYLPIRLSQFDGTNP